MHSATWRLKGRALTHACVCVTICTSSLLMPHSVPAAGFVTMQSVADSRHLDMHLVLYIELRATKTRRNRAALVSKAVQFARNSKSGG